MYRITPRSHPIHLTLAKIKMKNWNLIFLIAVISACASNGGSDSSEGTSNFDSNLDIVDTIPVAEVEPEMEGLEWHFIHNDSLIQVLTKDFFRIRDEQTFEFYEDYEVFENRYENYGDTIFGISVPYDTVFNYEINQFEMQFHKIASGKIFLSKVILSNSAVELSGGLRIGIPRVEVEKFLNLEQTTVDISVSDEAEFEGFNFIFRENSLVEITYDGVLD